MAKPGTAARRPDMDNGRSDSFLRMLALEKQYRVICSSSPALLSRPFLPQPRLSCMFSALGSVEHYSFFSRHTPGHNMTPHTNIKTNHVNVS